MSDMARFPVFSRQDEPLFDLDGRITRAERTERVNGEHKLDIETTQVLAEGMRILRRDGTLRWREWVIDEPDYAHADGDAVLGTYGCTWSMQYDLATVSGGELWPGTYDPIPAREALELVLSAQSRWEVGNVTVGTVAGTSLYDGQVWDYLGKLIEFWGGEMEPRIEVGADGVTHRYVDWLAHVGNEEATRRFDYGADCTSIRRTPAPGPRYSQIVPRGGRDATDADGISYSERVGIEEETEGGVSYIRDEEADIDFRVPDPSAEDGWHHPELVVCYDTDDPEELYALALADLHEYTRPKTTYEADVLQFAAAGMDAQGVQLGDEVQIVDRMFGDAPLRLQARVVEITVNELDDTDVSLVIGDIEHGIETSFKAMRQAIEDADSRARRIEGAGTLVYLQDLIDQLNAEINATGGYSYVVKGRGIVTYDRAVSDPNVGIEATKVVEVRGGSIRIADSRDSNGEWEWRSVFDAGRVAAEMVVAGQMTSGYIRSADGNVFIDLDNGIMQLASSTSIGGTQLMDALEDAKRYATDYLRYENGELTIGAANSAIRNVMTNSRQSFRTDAGDVAWFGLNDANIWEMFIETATIRNRLSFGDFSWIARDNGNMTLKWMGV